MPSGSFLSSVASYPICILILKLLLVSTEQSITSLTQYYVRIRPTCLSEAHDKLRLRPLLKLFCVEPHYHGPRRYGRARICEIEALQSIFIDEFSWIDEPSSFEISLQPAVDEGGEIHVHASLKVTFVENYPSESIPDYDLRSVKGLSDSILGEMKELAVKTSTEDLGGPVVYNVCEALKEWLTDHNFPGQDGSMYAEMMRKGGRKEIYRNGQRWCLS